MQAFPFHVESENDQERQLAIELQKHMALYGYTPIETPIVERIGMFIAQEGDPSVQQGFTFEWDGKQLALRPGFTLTAAHRYVRRKRQDIVRWQFGGPLFDVDPTNAENRIQRYGVGAELIGISGPAPEAEIISMATRGLMTQGINDWTLYIGHAELTRQLLSRFGLDTPTQHFKS